MFHPKWISHSINKTKLWQNDNTRCTITYNPPPLSFSPWHHFRFGCKNMDIIWYFINVRQKNKCKHSGKCGQMKIALKPKFHAVYLSFDFSLYLTFCIIFHIPSTIFPLTNIKYNFHYQKRNETKQNKKKPTRIRILFKWQIVPSS